MTKLTPKQEKFCHKYVEIGNASEAYRQSYNCENMKQNTIHTKAGELLSDGKITVRLNELRSEHKKRHNITVDSLLDELEEARITSLSSKIPQTSSAVSATMGKAKLLGLDKQIIDHTSSDGSMSPPPKFEFYFVEPSKKNEDTAE
ncbi:terminase small subunit [Francisella tularensis]|uniref:terminase small subunit n=1 Tax=Francisella tularensis TaxID=263 RepID=UPI0008F53FE0|nr:terminase small subunit [Francisella tularensis]APA83248.1 Phage terminase, small subunit [Francisella tularensis subsp. novicida PA10-7858]